MANKKNLKKDINYITGEILTECYTHLYLFPDKNEKKVLSIITKTVDTRNNFIARVNNPKIENSTAKKYYNSLIEEIITNTNNLSEELSKLNK